MADAPKEHAPPGKPAPAFRWQAFFQRSTEPLFVLNRQRRILFVNRAWEELTGWGAEQVLGQSCTRRKPAVASPWDNLGRTLCPPPEVAEGQPGHVRRLLVGATPSQGWWDINFFPLNDDRGTLCILGKVTLVSRGEAAAGTPLPEPLINVREKFSQRYGFDQLASELPALRQVASQVRLAAAVGAPVLLLGEQGTGKEWLARTIHHQGLSRERTYAALSCRHLPATALAEALFGANGLLHSPAVGMVYLKEPSGLPREIQEHLGDYLAEPAGPGPRVVAGCSTNPAEEVQAGKLHPAFSCALGTLIITIPPLRDRLADLPFLVDSFLARIQAEEERRIIGLTAAAWDLCRSYRWPGNLRELYIVLTGACMHARSTQIDAGDLPAYLRLMMTLDRTPGPEKQGSLPLDDLLKQTERRLIQLALHRAHGNKTLAAELLAIWRPRLHRRMEALGIPDHES